MPASKGRITRVDIHQPECNALLRAPGGAVYNRVAQYGLKTEILAKAEAPVETGRGRASISSNMSIRGKRVMCVIGTGVFYMRIQHQGTGPIYPKKAKALRFKPKGAGYFVFAKKTRGVPATPFLVKALEQGCPWPAQKNTTS